MNDNTKTGDVFDARLLTTKEKAQEKTDEAIESANVPTDPDGEPAPARARRTRAAGAATRERILEAASAVIAEEGTDALSIDHVIKRAGISKGAFLYHFPSRLQLVEALAERYAAHLREVAVELEREAPQLTARPKVDLYIEWYRRFHGEKLDGGRSPLVGLVCASRENRRFIEPVRTWYRGYYDALDPKIDRRSTELTALLALDGLFFHHLFGTDVLSETERAAVLERIERIVRASAREVGEESSEPDAEKSKTKK
ncbi:TetR/AcrR family transcriptional regulator [Sutterella megalosphaeroides]|uniref:HTH tetR-type domain-containing protein n=1 Tax=Sutterella megalosphaeroides TaxID=2494234 RepID=A0A2Z6I937_9BURK|nr:TetR/AcrR family transcriptional regulator [Sutterella megalosphaeroides]BBF22995.1 hypothetical protein SUTMEG_08860 [Sutterella megalosphaeroides]